MKQTIGFITFLCLSTLMLDAKPKPPAKVQPKIATAPTEQQYSQSPIVIPPLNVDSPRTTSSPNSLLETEYPVLTEEETQYELPLTEDSQSNFQELEQLGQKDFPTPTASDPKRSKTPPVLPDGWETALVDPEEAIVEPSVKAKIEKATATTEDISWIQLMLNFYQEKVADTFLLEQIANGLGIKTVYSFLVNEIQTTNFEACIKYFNEKNQDSAGIRLIDKAIHQAVRDKKRAELITIINAAQHYGFFAGVNEKAKEKAGIFLTGEAQTEQDELASYMKKKGNNLAVLTDCIMATRNHTSQQQDPSAFPLGAQSRKAAQEFTNFASGKRLLLKSPPTSPREE